MIELLDRPLVRVAAFWALIHFVALGLISGLIFVLAHIPPKAVNLDSLILAVHWVYDLFYTPIALVRWLWPGESSPWVLNVLLRVLGSGLVGAAAAGLLEAANRGARSARPDKDRI